MRLDIGVGEILLALILVLLFVAAIDPDVGF